MDVENPIACAVCGESAPSGGRGYQVTVDTWHHEESVVAFCSWEHFGQWVGRGAPEFVPLSGFRKQDWAATVGCLGTLLVGVVLSAIGLVAVLKAVF